MIDTLKCGTIQLTRGICGHFSQFENYLWMETKMALTYIDDLFMLQVRLFRLAQVRWNKNPKECVAIFNKYDINSYIETCYEEYHVQGSSDFIEIAQFLSW